MLLLLICDNCIWSKSLNKHPRLPVWLLCRLRHRSFWNQCISFLVWYIGVLRRSIVLVWSHISARCLEYAIYKTKHCRCTIYANYNDGVRKISCIVSVEQATITWYMNYCYKATLRLPKMQDRISLRLHWHWFPGWGREGATVAFDANGS